MARIGRPAARHRSNRPVATLSAARRLAHGHARPCTLAGPAARWRPGQPGTTMLRALDDLIERRIRDAQREGQFDDLPGAGKPLVIADDPLVPEEVRLAFRVLKNAGFVPAEVAALKDIDLLIAQIVDEAAAHDGDGAVAGDDDEFAAMPGAQRCDRFGAGGPDGRCGQGEARAGGAGEPSGRRAARRLLALTMALERQGINLTTHSALAYRRALIRRLQRGER